MILHRGKFFGTTSEGGAHAQGTVFELIPKSTAPWTEKILHSFSDTSSIVDGFGPEAGVISDASGKLYGTTFYWGAYQGGTAFELALVSGVWTETLLHSFVQPGSGSTDGSYPTASLTLDAAGKLYGTTSGGGVYGGGTVFEIAGTPTSTSVTSSLNPSIYGQSITFTATVSASSGTPTGKVTFKSGSATLGTATMTGGVASFTTTTLGAGTKSITAVYSGKGLLFAGSTSPVLTQVVNKATTSVTLTSSSNPSSAGQSVTFTATVAPQFSGTPNGTVTFKDGTTKIGSATLTGGVASIATSSLGSGTHSITATYGGNTNFSASSGALTQTVN